MARTERIGNIGYLGLAPQVSALTSVAATDFIPLYDESVTTNRQIQDLAPAFGNKFEVFDTIYGQRQHMGDVTVLAEPNTALKLFDALLTRGTQTSFYTITCTSANATINATYTNNGVTFTVLGTIASGTTLLLSGPGVPTASGTLTKASGTGDSTITFSAFVNTNNTWPLTLATTGETYYTYDISTGNIVKRFFGVKASKIVPSWNNNELQLKVSISALGSFAGREIASVSGSGPTVITLKTDYDAAPTNGLVNADLLRIYKADGTTIDTTVTSFTGTTVTVPADASAAAAGDFIYLRPATVAFSLLPSFKWTDTEFRFASTASAALSATQLRVEQGSVWEIDHNFNSNSGEHRSGSQDPESLARTTGMASLTVKKFFDTPEDVKAYHNLAKSACVIRHFSYSGGNTYELRITMNSLTTDDPLPSLKPKQINYSNIKYHTSYNQSDSQGMDVKILNGLKAIT